ncbi:(2,3-dihydroxybenzoyl)adenylate synthase [Amycolatopsis endophytica]|uniref:2,3-dihydroxybenzoate-AMP ligase n=1 Tax=Amycolatopsis endophytica TaxID=860233 RepID=A0A853BCQ7_9PSEU|nr:(2,3-dihydroxybenzoyl)adenylate synthase [Amycolatopsis endophytica]NYI92534.1 2,3-dihydroxybenzoate-AMP ligase [Amycolatopsis endophytica]
MSPFPEEFARRYREAGYWTGQTFPDLLAGAARTHGDRVAVVDGERRWTYSELASRAARVAAGLHALGVRAGDRVVVQLPNTAEYFETVFALFHLGALPVFSLPAHRFADIGYFCEHAEAVAYVIPARHDGFDYTGLADQVTAAVPGLKHVVVVGETGRYTSFDSLREHPEREAHAPAPDEVAFLQLSGGSTGTPKLIPRTHDDYLYSVRESADICGLTQDSVYLVALPAAHNFPMSSPGSLGVFHAGGTVVLAPSPAPEVVFPLIESERVTITAVVPPLALAWLRAAGAATEDLSSLEVLQVGGAKFSEEAARRVRPELGCTLQQVFGMAEGLVNYTRLDDPEDLITATQGRPISPDDEVRIVDDQDEDVPEGATGHLLTRGPYTIRGYYRAPEHNAVAFTADGFYRTGDVVRRTPEGYLVVEGRAKDQINRGGEKVAAEEVENQLLAHPAVHDAAVVPMPDTYLGERTCAFVIPQDPAQAPRPAEFKRFLRERGLAEFKLPDRIRIVAEFPHTPVGKVSKAALRQAIARALRGEES